MSLGGSLVSAPCSSRRPRLRRGKLDWVMVRQMGVAKSDIGNHEYALSDHKWLSLELRPLRQ